MKKFMAILMAAVFMAALAACGSGGENQTADKSTKDTSVKSDTSGESTGEKGTGDIKLAFLGAGSNTFGVTLKAAADEKAAELGVTLDYFLANMDLPTQISQIEACITQGYDAIILQPANAQGIVDSVDAIHEAGIPLVLVNMSVDSENYGVYVGSDNIEAGRIQGEWLLEKTKDWEEVNIGYITVTMGTSTQIDRLAGFEEAYMDVADNYQVLSYGESKAQRDLGMSIMEDWLLAYPQMNVVVCQNDSAALGAMQAIVDAGKSDDILLLGIDAEPDAIQGIIDGEFSMSVYQDAYGQGVTSVEVAVGLAQGETYEKTVMIPYIPIDSENAEESMKEIYGEE